MTLMRCDRFRELDRWSEQALAGSRRVRTVPVEALRRCDRFVVALDLPAVAGEEIDVTVEHNVVTVRAPLAHGGDEVIVDERPDGEFSRQLFLGENLDGRQAHRRKSPTWCSTSRSPSPKPAR